MGHTAKEAMVCSTADHWAHQHRAYSIKSSRQSNKHTTTEQTIDCMIGDYTGAEHDLLEQIKSYLSHAPNNAYLQALNQQCR